MKTRVIISLVGILAIATFAAAQPAMRTPEEQAKQLKEQLKLSDEQTTAVAKVLTEQREKMMNLRENGTRGPEMRDAFMKLADETTGKILKILDEDQQKEYKKLMEKRRQMRRRRG